MKHYLLRWKRLVPVVATWLVASSTASAFTGGLTGGQVVDHASRVSVQQLPVVDGAISWTILLERAGDGASASSNLDTRIKDLDSKQIKIVGFMLPAESSAGVARFWLSASPPPCDFETPADVPMLIEVRPRAPIAFTADPVLLSGRFVVVEKGNAAIYRLDDAMLEPLM